jgi:hypothetical protein
MTRKLTSDYVLGWLDELIGVANQEHMDEQVGQARMGLEKFPSEEWEDIPAAAYLWANPTGGEESLSWQRTRVHAYAAGRGYRLVREEVDRGTAGDGHALRRLLQAAKDGEFRVLVVDESSRLGRDPAGLAAVLGSLRLAGVTIDTVADSHTGRPHQQLTCSACGQELPDGCHPGTTTCREWCNEAARRLGDCLPEGVYHELLRARQWCELFAAIRGGRETIGEP